MALFGSRFFNKTSKELKITMDDLGDGQEKTVFSDVAGIGKIIFDLLGGKLEIKGLADPTDTDDAVNKGYVDGLVGDIETALDSIIAIQEQLIGGAE